MNATGAADVGRSFQCVHEDFPPTNVELFENPTEAHENLQNHNTFATIALQNGLHDGRRARVGMS